MSDAACVFAVYRFRPEVTDATIVDLLRRHRTVLEKTGLVTEKLPTVVRSTRGEGAHRDVIEIFEWKNEAAVGAAHSQPAVREIWSEFESLTTQPAVALRELAEAAQPFAHFAPFVMTYERRASNRMAAPKASTKAAPATRAKAAPAARAKTAPAKAARKGTVKVKRMASKVAKPKALARKKGR